MRRCAVICKTVYFLDVRRPSTLGSDHERRWDVSRVTDMSDLFDRPAGRNDDNTFNDDIGGWNTSSVTNMSGMFGGCSAFNKVHTRTCIFFIMCV